MAMAWSPDRPGVNPNLADLDDADDMVLLPLASGSCLAAQEKAAAGCPTHAAAGEAGTHEKVAKDGLAREVPPRN